MIILHRIKYVVSFVSYRRVIVSHKPQNPFQFFTHIDTSSCAIDLFVRTELLKYATVVEEMTLRVSSLGGMTFVFVSEDL